MIKQKKSTEIKNKFINNLIVNGKKNKSEKIISQAIKTLQIISKKSSQKLIQLALICNSPIFKLSTITQKKKKKKKQKSRILPTFIHNKTSRISSAIKFIVKTIRKKRQPLFKKLTEEILLSSQDKSNTIEIKKETQKQASLNRHLFKYYRWH